MEVAEVLVSLALDDGPAGVVRDGVCQVWLSYSLDRVSGTGVADYRPVHPGCGGTGWDEVRANDDSRGMRGSTTNRPTEPPAFVDYEG